MSFANTMVIMTSNIGSRSVTWWRPADESPPIFIHVWCVDRENDDENEDENDEPSELRLHPARNANFIIEMWWKEIFLINIQKKHVRTSHPKVKSRKENCILVCLIASYLKKKIFQTIGFWRFSRFPCFVPVSDNPIWKSCSQLGTIKKPTTLGDTKPQASFR